MRKDPRMLPKIYAVDLSLSLPPKGTSAFARVIVHWWKGNNQTFQGLLDTGSELKLMPGDPKCHCDPPVRGQPDVSQEINGVLAQVCLIEGPVGP